MAGTAGHRASGANCGETSVQLIAVDLLWPKRLSQQSPRTSRSIHSEKGDVLIPGCTTRFGTAWKSLVAVGRCAPPAGAIGGMCWQSAQKSHRIAQLKIVVRLLGIGAYHRCDIRFDRRAFRIEMPREIRFPPDQRLKSIALRRAICDGNIGDNAGRLNR